MIPFLKQVADHYYAEGKLDKLCMIFPNRRSMVFFGKWLADAVKNDVHAVPVHAPEMLTMNDFFYKVSGASATDRISLLLELYSCYKALNKNAESLDDFIFWGDIILGDFDDTDKYLADPERLFTNIADFKEIQDTYSYLTEEQAIAIRRFVEHFRKGGKLTVNLDADNPNVKERFLKIWNLLYPLYCNFNVALRSGNMAYEGMVYRSFVKRLRSESAIDILRNAFPRVEKFVFVGLNALNECEKTVLRKLHDAGVAEFCWDWSSAMIRDPQNRASMFMSENVKEFPQAFKIDSIEVLPSPKIHILSIPSSVGQTKQIPDILKSIASEKSGGDLSEVGRLDSKGTDTAIVLPDENLLIPLLNSIPEEISSVNVTMGYPMLGSGVYSLMSDISSLQLHIRKRQDGWYFYHKQVWAILSSGIVRSIMDDSGKELSAKIKNESKYYIPQSDFAGHWLTELIFRPVVEQAKTPSATQVKNICDYQLEVLRIIGAKISSLASMRLEVHFAKQYYLAVNRLKDIDLEVLPMTYVRLLQQLIGGVSVPFKGEPLKGLQIMGPLETRSLDFTNIIITSCNEGVFPRRSVSSSFIPPELRKGFGLPTYENQDAVWAYYFYRMIQRAENVWLMYDSRTEGLHSGEESRYIKQLEYQYKYPQLYRNAVRYRIDIPENNKVIEKTTEDLEVIRSMRYSASSLKNYLVCPAKFYYSSIKKLRQEDEVSESLDGAMLGSVFHDTMYALYKGGEALAPEFDMSRENVESNVKAPLEEITEEYISELLSDKDKIIRPKVRALIKKQLNSVDVSGRNLVLEDIINQYVEQTLNCDLKLMAGKGVHKFKILGLERLGDWNFDGFKFFGYIDRMDSFESGKVRIVDYKTGIVADTDVSVNANNASEFAEKLFKEDADAKDRPVIALQLFLYEMFAKKMVPDSEIEKVVYPIPKLFSYDILSSDECKEFNEKVENGLHGIFEELVNPDVGFRHTQIVGNCSNCDFRKICGR